MKDLDGRIRGVDPLAAGTTRTADLDSQILRADLDVDLLGLGKDRHGGRGGMDASLGLGGWDTLDAVDSALVAKPPEDILSEDLENDFLEPTRIAGARLDHLGPQSLRLGVPRVHPVKITRKDRCLRSSGPGPDLDDRISVIVRLRGEEGQQDHLLQTRDALIDREDLRGGKFRHLDIGSGRKLLVFSQLASAGFELIPCSDQLLEP